jgi:ABC-type sugar transport system substrate-binding protein
MKKLLITTAILAFAAPAFAADTGKTVGQAPPSGASSFYIAQDTASMRCEVLNNQPAAGGKQRVLGNAYPTQAAAQTALTAEKACTK